MKYLEETCSDFYSAKTKLRLYPQHSSDERFLMASHGFSEKTSLLRRSDPRRINLTCECTSGPFSSLSGEQSWNKQIMCSLIGFITKP